MLSLKFIHLSLISATLAIAIPLAETSCSVASILDSALEALGGESVLNDLNGVTYHSPNVYRSRSLMQSYEMTRADTFIAISGHQNISFSFMSEELQQRIDRQFVPSSYWVWGSPTLNAFNFSLVVQSGDDGFACYVNGNNQIWLPSDLASGYTDAALAEYLVLHGNMLDPRLLLRLKSSNATSASEMTINNVKLLSVHDSDLDLTVIFDPATNLPYIVRTFEDHAIYGASTFDLYLNDYKTVEGLNFPHQIQSVYNSSSQNLDAVLEDYTIEQITLNPKFPSGFFDGIAEEESMFPKAAPRKVQGFSHARITEFSSNMLWSGLKNTTAEDLKSKQPIPGLPSVHWLILEGDELGVKQLIIEFETEVIVCDAAPQHSISVIQWIAENLKKPITHLWPTHHHRDHSGGAKDFVEAGAKLIVPEMAVKYWSSIPNATFVTFNDTHPYVHSDEYTQAWFLWEQQGSHAADLSYSFVTTKCPSNDSPVAVFEADVWQAGMPPEQSDQALMRQWLDQVLNDGLTKDAIVLPTHGQVTPLLELINITGYAYPQLSTLDWRAGAAKCDARGNQQDLLWPRS
ncbi:hypothetical protein B0J13DRAFT_478345 [Dactylonectria estremocensis]|uniref:Metallo-beta-lactamase domain-containing protein n=1 Tax=Dactylonectria estremocensis TaxID=1079267 RepID=A0A9P9J3I5_9HYPO|nr:hypothetical protein B0J13DRAFT_478345 [Dactylonectria estremocensis]